MIPTQNETIPYGSSNIGVTISKPWYRLSLPTSMAPQNLCSLGVEVPADQLNPDAPLDLFSVRPIELGLRSVVPSEDLFDQDIDMNTPLKKIFRLNTDNTPEGSELLLVSAGEITDLGAEPSPPGESGELFLMDFISETGGSPTSSDLRASDTALPFENTRYLAVALSYTEEITDLTNVTAIVDRSDYTPKYSGEDPIVTVTLDTFFSPVQLSPVNGNRFSFSDATRAGISPQPDLNIALLSVVPTDGDMDIFWTLMGDGTKLSFDLPILPPEAAGILAVAASDQLMWTQSVFSLSLCPSFDFDNYNMSDFGKYVTHLSANTFESNADADGDGIPLFEDKWPTLNNTLYSGDVVPVNGVEFGSTCEIECVATQSMTIGPNVVVKSGAQVTFKSPVVEVNGIHFEPGAKVQITHTQP